MFVITADQRGSRSSRDLVPAAIDEIRTHAGPRLLLPPDRTAGDEVQAATDSAGTALELALRLTRSERWSVGLGIGEIETPLPEATRAARGSAFVHARDAVERAKRAPNRFALSGDDPEASADAEALVRLLIELRDRRTEPGWEVADLLAGGLTQQQAAAELGISPAAISMRVRSAAVRVEEPAIRAIERVLQRLSPAAASVERA